MMERLFPVHQEQLTVDDCYTPTWVFERMGIEFDLDVASPPGGIDWIPAKRYYTQTDDGLAAPWEGRIWMNPPFSNAKPWVERFIGHRNGVCLIPAATARWFHRLWMESDALVLPCDTCIKFVNGAINGVPIRIVMAAFGDECVEAIGRLGVIRTVKP